MILIGAVIRIMVRTDFFAEIIRRGGRGMVWIFDFDAALSDP